jgi:hypothetical protein
MEPIRISSKSPGNVQVEGIPDAIRLIKVDGPKARRLADLALHRSDLKFAKDCLEAINRVPVEDDRTREALWRCAILHYFKCFGVSAQRFNLDAARIYRDRPPAAMMNFEFFKGMRNKHFSHDENAYMECSIGAAINDGTKSYKVEQVTPLVATYSVLGQESFSNLMLLIDNAERWVATQFDECVALIKSELENLPYEELVARPGPELRVPTVEDAGKPRR